MITVFTILVLVLALWIWRISRPEGSAARLAARNRRQQRRLARQSAKQARWQRNYNLRHGRMKPAGFGKSFAATYGGIRLIKWFRSTGSSGGSGGANFGRRQG